MGTERGHASASANIDHLAHGWLHMEVAEGTDAGDRVAGLKAEQIAGADAGRAILTGWRGGDTHVEAKRVLGLLVACEGIIVTAIDPRVTGHKVKDVLVLPHGRERLGNVEVAEVHRVICGYIELQVVARCEDDSF